MHKWFHENFSTGLAWLSAKNNYSRSLAVTSMVGHIIGLGDRHLENIQICRKYGQVVHIDLNMIFDRGLNLPVPEVVPFRMTPTMVDGCGVAGLNGHFRKTAIFTLRLAQNKKEILRRVISVFLGIVSRIWIVYILNIT